MATFRSIPRTELTHYRVNVEWGFLKYCIDRYTKEYNLDFDPIFQRGYVWNDKQKIAYIKYIIKGGTSGKEIYFNI